MSIRQRTPLLAAAIVLLGCCVCVSALYDPLGTSLAYVAQGMQSWQVLVGQHRPCHKYAVGDQQVLDLA
jgi:hypothetical protein